TYTAFDVLYRFLIFPNLKVNYTQNVTDIDDDILKRAKRDKKDWQELGNFWTEKYVNDMATLNNVKPTHYVKATETMPTIITFITKLVADGFAYERGGNVYFDVSKDPEYGKLSKYSRTEMIKLSTLRGADPTDPRKRDPLDFIMWQKSLPDEPFWGTPWSKGRPGWHIECSAMAYKYLDKRIDIHGGGHDLIYPHHESEIAQSEAFTGLIPFSQFWMHTGAVGYKGEKMSKSLGNLIMVSELLKKYSPNTIRYLLLSHHYREPWEYEECQIKEAVEKMKQIENEIKHLKPANNKSEKYLAAFTDSLADDLDTLTALEIINKAVQSGDDKAVAVMAEVLGFQLP
ncbi:MAG: cysteine--tRNA ligase, partial [Candidatus Levyibacteriota bacterium]